MPYCLQKCLHVRHCLKSEKRIEKMERKKRIREIEERGQRKRQRVTERESRIAKESYAKGAKDAVTSELFTHVQS